MHALGRGAWARSPFLAAMAGIGDEQGIAWCRTGDHCLPGAQERLPGHIAIEKKVCRRSERADCSLDFLWHR